MSVASSRNYEVKTKAGALRQNSNFIVSQICGEGTFSPHIRFSTSGSNYLLNGKIIPLDFKSEVDQLKFIVLQINTIYLESPPKKVTLLGFHSPVMSNYNLTQEKEPPKLH